MSQPGQSRKRLQAAKTGLGKESDMSGMMGICIQINGNLETAVNRGITAYKKRTGKTAVCVSLPQEMADIREVEGLIAINHIAQPGHLLVGERLNTD